MSAAVAEAVEAGVEITPDGIRDYRGTYEEYVHACGDDHLDTDTVVLKARREEKKAKAKEPSANGSRPPTAPRANAKVDAAARGKLERRRDELTGQIEAAEARVVEIDRTFAAPGYYEQTPADGVALLLEERAGLQERVERLMGDWEEVERQLETAG